jgi:hypothetical protein
MRRRFYGSKILPMVTKHGLCVEAICGSRSCVLTLVLRDSRQIFPSLLCFDQNRHFCVNTLLLHRPGHRTRATDPGRRCRSTALCPRRRQTWPVVTMTMMVRRKRPRVGVDATRVSPRKYVHKRTLFANLPKDVCQVNCQVVGD